MISPFKESKKVNAKVHANDNRKNYASDFGGYLAAAA
jgi:hypothetical protein